jgi:hypothetical protein
MAQKRKGGCIVTLDLTAEEFELVLAGLSSMVHDNRFSANRQWDAQQLGKRLHQLQEGK